ncbi:E3 ubiquitin-protein ligase AIRP2-like [Juglans microcarpa x Juglans regia]|uniref:E3 ubiquitin-protein ligase AIRP2-like n=1 Tax=Juglans microcarpa x Juglans regia TaxID=2249226 RepID=UPI001B7F6DE8|nr:E3 ubiquitin-protein ligase AIRP2-like [Juglans microcarpa x Juglans regia]
MWQKQSKRSCFKESLKTLEADIQHANTLANALPRDYCGDYIQLRLSYSPFAPFLLYLIEWMDYSCTDALPSYLGLLEILIYKVYVDGMPTMSSKERKATLREFYAVIYPSLRQLEGEFIELPDDTVTSHSTEVSTRKRGEGRRKLSDNDDLERDEECGICMENCTRMLLPGCGHAMCHSCFHDWNARSQSCPFCRGSLKQVDSKDLWVLISNNDVIDVISLAKENLRRFYLYMENLPLRMPDTHLVVYDYML